VELGSIGNFVGTGEKDHMIVIESNGGQLIVLANLQEGRADLV
jgi:hypothetical protein